MGGCASGLSDLFSKVKSKCSAKAEACLNKNLLLSLTPLNALFPSLPQQTTPKPAQVVPHLLQIIQDNIPGLTSSGSEAPRITSILQALLPVLAMRPPPYELFWRKNRLLRTDAGTHSTTRSSRLSLATTGSSPYDLGSPTSRSKADWWRGLLWFRKKM